MGACFVKICVDLIWFQKMEVTIRPHSLWSLCRVATTSSTPWDKIVPSLLNFEVEVDKVVNGIDQSVNGIDQLVNGIIFDKKTKGSKDIH